jgi:hypothetical protein
MPYQAGSSAQRIRIGLTGLAVAFLVVLLASVVSRASRDDVSNGAQQVNESQPSEPLAELGVAPGASDSDNAAGNSVSSKPAAANPSAGSTRRKK